MGFITERCLFNTALGAEYFQNIMLSDNLMVWVEPKGLFGIPDLLVIDCKESSATRGYKTIAYEMKLRNWRKAVQQAYRYRAFCEEVYVLLDSEHVNIALANRNIFEQTKIGLMSISQDGVLTCHISSDINIPYCDSYDKALDALKDKYQEIEKEDTSDCETSIQYNRAHLPLPKYCELASISTGL